MEDRKENIIKAAKFLFSEKGYSGTGLREIADNAGVSIGNIYNYFKNKEEIFHYILEPENIIHSLSGIPKLINEHFPFNLDELILASKKVIDENIEIYTLIFIDLIEFGGYNTNRIIQGIIDFGQSVFESKIKDNFVGKTIKDLDYNFFVKVFVIAMLSFFITTNILPSAKIENYSEKEISKMLSKVILNGIII